MQYNLFIDTNLLKINKGDLTKFEVDKTYYVVKDFIRDMKLDNIKIFIPRIVFEELLQQYREDYSSITSSIEDKIKSISNELVRLNWNVQTIKFFQKTNREYKEYIRKSLDDFLKREDAFLEIVENPSDCKLNSIITRAINKEYPFFGDTKNKKKVFSDAGFKDTIFLESILEKLKDLEGKCFILTQDDYLKNVNLEKELMQRKVSNCSCEFSSWSSGDAVVRGLERFLGIEHRAEYIRFCRDSYYSETIERSFGCKVKEISEDIKLIEEDGEMYVDIDTLVEKNKCDLQTVVRISDSREFISMSDALTDEVIHQW
ncbi:PIN domain-containing protein [Clostridium tertium]|uniref:PIN domain-containing protein n=1 Tax=Clostridium tertium TaxID=1559 RepID=UPI002331259C|nr:PIN domain-containing protein [Clostridium tertium]MDB1954224.1 PIN domain-containing protein [Clostridium tertium]MDB1957861.1 PIN domain-containing protein [Clostridium tertium]MDB1961687.1 PIN domain-containing protein [Clostridium tertium]MDB1965030.1 PIN domain-containing protein [Clostridium tertium]